MRRFATAVLAVFTISLALVSAQDASEAHVQVREGPEYAPHLANDEGFSLYLYVKDEGEEESACTGGCTRNWPPLTVEGDPIAGEGVDSELLGTISREDGETQITYNGWPLYTYARDAQAGDTKGQALGGAFFLVSPEGERITEALAQEAPEVDDEVFAEMMDQGKRLFSSNCAVCHGAEGQGAIGPRLAKNRNVGNTGFFVERILLGFPAHGMPPFGHLSDEQVAALATFVRNSWGNEFGAVIPEEVSEERP